MLTLQSRLSIFAPAWIAYELLDCLLYWNISSLLSCLWLTVLSLRPRSWHMSNHCSMWDSSLVSLRPRVASSGDVHALWFLSFLEFHRVFFIRVFISFNVFVFLLLFLGEKGKRIRKPIWLLRVESLNIWIIGCCRHISGDAPIYSAILKHSPPS